MKREIVKIDRELCDGCGLCIPNCQEGALQMIDGKATLVSELMCDGLGACIGHCPQGAITIEVREAEPYNEITVIKEMAAYGVNVITSHLKHLKEHSQTEFLHQALEYMKQHPTEFQFNVNEVITSIEPPKNMNPKQVFSFGQHQTNHQHTACPGSREMSFASQNEPENIQTVAQVSQLRQWPVQMHLVNPNAAYFKNSDLVVAADCVAYALGNFHSDYLKGKSLAIACPKLDEGQEIYFEKLVALVEQAKVNTITVMIMEVPCCRGLVQLVAQAVATANRKVPVKAMVVGIQGDILKEDWI